MDSNLTQMLITSEHWVTFFIHMGRWRIQVVGVGMTSVMVEPSPCKDPVLWGISQIPAQGYGEDHNDRNGGEEDL